ncbi:MAG: hypothetical protein WA996_20535 [Candidatus Promineifilaceae bacterium]
MNRLKPFVSWPMFCMTMVMTALLIACSGPDGEGIESSARLQTPALAPVVDTPTTVVTLETPEAAGPSPEPFSDSRWVDGTPTPTPYLALNSEQNPAPTMTPSPTLGLPLPVTELTRPLYFLSKDHVTSSGTGKPQGVWRLDPGSTVVELITPPELNITSFDLWLGDGRMAYGTSIGQIYLVMPDGQNRLLYDAGLEAGETVQISSVVWSPEGERLAFTSLFGHPTIAGQSDGLRLLTLGVDEPVKLLNNRHLDSGRDNVNEYRAFSAVDWAPDGSALLLKGSFWEYSDILWLDPIIPDPDEANLHALLTAWSDGSWANDSRSILLSGLNRGSFSHLDRANIVTEDVNRLLDGEIVKLGILKAQELPAGIAFLTRESSLEDASESYRLYLGHQLEGEFQYALAGPDHTLCNSGYVWDITWDPEGYLAAVSCDRGVQLISIDGTIDVDLTPLLEPSVGENLLKVYWGQT